MAYAEELLEDRREHRKYHDTVVNGIPSRKLKSDRVIWEGAAARVLAIRHRGASLNDRRRAETGTQLAPRDTPFDFAAYHAGDSDDGRDPHVFLLEVKARLVGVLVAERCEYVRRFTWAECDQPTGGPLPKGDPVWSICMVWVHRKHQRQGFATVLVTKATEFLGTSLTAIGWYTPFTESGRGLAQRLCPESFLVAK